ncbi:MAG: TlpA disulfide reductase family protein [Cyclobacteriaceae bacterium]
MLTSPIALYGQQSFVIAGNGERLQSGDSIFLSYKQDNNYVLKTAVVSDKKFSFSGLVNKPVRATLYRNENPERVNFIMESVQVYLETGTIQVDYRSTTGSTTVSGTGLNDTLQLLQNDLKSLLLQRMQIKDPDFFTEAEKRDTARVSRNKAALEQIFYQEADAKLAFAARYPNSYVSLMALSDVSRINSYIFETDTVFRMLPESLQQTPEGKKISDRILKKKQVLPGMKTVDFTLPDSHNNMISLSSFNGKYVLLDFWASWCGPCREEHPNLKQVYEQYRSRGLVVISVSIDTDKQKWLNAIAKDGLTWPQLSDLKANQSEVYLAYGITSIPANFLIDLNGIVIAKDLKGEALKRELSQIFPKQ